MDLLQFFQEFQDYLAPKLDAYEQVIYLYLFRHSHYKGNPKVQVSIKSARRQMAFGMGEGGKPMSEASCAKKLISLETKGCLKKLDSGRAGTLFRIYLPSEIDGVMPSEQEIFRLSLEEMDFYNVPENRIAIIQREYNKCFYCLRSLTSSNVMIEHVVSRPHGNNSYRNLVASCQNCNNRKSKNSAEDFIRTLYRGGYLSETDFEQRLLLLQSLKNGDLKPTI